jgi:tetratricopeptide (TPR) repeat protein
MVWLLCLFLTILSTLLSTDNSWKLTDFGVFSNATSKHDVLTQHSRGTSSYRAPELLRENATFNNKVDIWGLGCILHELATSKVAFHQDWAVRQYETSNVILPFSMPSSKFLEHHMAENVRELLHIDSSQRPRAASVCRLYSTYCRIFCLPVAQILLDSESYSSYLEWKQLAEEGLSEFELLARLAEGYEYNGHKHDANSILQGALLGLLTETNNLENLDVDHLHIPINRWGWLADQFAKGERNKEAIILYREAIRHRPRHLFLRRQLANVFIKLGERHNALQTYEAAIKIQPWSFWLWRDLCELHLSELDNINRAIRVCKKGKYDFPDSPSPLMALINLYSAKSDYSGAIQAGITLLGHQSETRKNLLTGLSEITENLLPPPIKGERRHG